MLDATYAAKAAAAALALATSSGAGSAGRRVLLWITFDGRPFADADSLRSEASDDQPSPHP
jgi:hypothetical protein